MRKLVKIKNNIEEGDLVQFLPLDNLQNTFTEVNIDFNGVYKVGRLGSNILSLEEFPDYFFPIKIFKNFSKFELEFNCGESSRYSEVYKKLTLTNGYNLPVNLLVNVTSEYYTFKGIIHNTFIKNFEIVTENNETFTKVPSLEVRTVFNPKGLKSKDVLIVRKDDMISYLGHTGLGENKKIEAKNVKTKNWENINLTSLNIYKEDYILLDFYFFRPDMGGTYFKVNKDFYISLPFDILELFKIGKDKQSLKENTAVFVKSLKMTGNIKNIVKTSGKVYYYVELDNNTYTTTEFKNLKIIK